MLRESGDSEVPYLIPNGFTVDINSVAVKLFKVVDNDLFDQTGFIHLAIARVFDTFNSIDCPSVLGSEITKYVFVPFAEKGTSDLDFANQVAGIPGFIDIFLALRMKVHIASKR
ncbi:hypothetical protein GOBAR_AA24342 [Gossypium barbadense]|uniref:Uncharacterized protein n=2 Tax=Gossypium TaxID=3633 RepID=A0ABR0Q923_GOSAR|nr:hypothetical protein PVK06_011240 [Gossypium arboreum]PPR96329.1 hypothetical protein GOBAR_AA24342 [Gossypium barbadense]